MKLWPDEHEGLRDEARALAPLVVDAVGFAAAEGARATRIAQRRKARAAHGGVTRRGRRGHCRRAVPRVPSPRVTHDVGDDERDEILDCYLPGLTREELRDARYSPLYAEQAGGLPPVLFTVGLADRGRARIDEFLERCLKEAGR